MGSANRRRRRKRSIIKSTDDKDKYFAQKKIVTNVTTYCYILKEWNKKEFFNISYVTNQ